MRIHAVFSASPLFCPSMCLRALGSGPRTQMAVSLQCPHPGSPCLFLIPPGPKSVMVGCPIDLTAPILLCACSALHPSLYTATSLTPSPLTSLSICCPPVPPQLCLLPMQSQAGSFLLLAVNVWSGMTEMFSGIFDKLCHPWRLKQSSARGIVSA